MGENTPTARCPCKCSTALLNRKISGNRSIEYSFLTPLPDFDKSFTMFDTPLFAQIGPARPRGGLADIKLPRCWADKARRVAR